MPESLFIITLLKKRLWHMCFPVSFAKFLRTPFFCRTPLVAASRYWLVFKKGRASPYLKYFELKVAFLAMLCLNWKILWHKLCYKFLVSAICLGEINFCTFHYMHQRKFICVVNRAYRNLTIHRLPFFHHEKFPLIFALLVVFHLRWEVSLERIPW